MTPRGCLHPLKLATSLALPCVVFPVWAAEPYPALPPTLSTSVTPNVMLYIDTSGSMLQDSNNAWMRRDLCDSNINWSACVNNNTNNYRTTIDSEALSPNTKMNIAKRVAKNLVTNNRKLRWGVFSFEDKPGSVGGAERAEAGVLRAPVQDVTNDTNWNAVKDSITALNGRTATPLGEGLLELTRYFEGKSSLYGKTTENYTSPIQYRCQKNFALVITDGDATGEDNLPGSDMDALAYTARDSNGNAVAKSFSVCTAADTTAADDLSVNCPASLEGSSATPGFGDGNNRFRALRDVAKYARVADLRVGGNDLDGKSFDDPKFPKQNLTTYTVGFTVNNDVLPATASVGGGSYYNANNETQLGNALNQAIDSINASLSNGGGLATVSPTSSGGNRIFQPIFNPTNWSGELRCFTFDANGGKGPACTPNPKGTIPAASSRKIFSSKVEGTATTAFDFVETNYTVNMTSSQTASLGANDAERKNTIKFIRGDDGISGLRSRGGNWLGDIVDGQPIVVSQPSGETPDTDYATFKTTNAARNLVLVGANDGMMHTFKIADMNELMGYVPSAVYPRIKALTAANYGQSAGTPHAYHVNGVMKSRDFKLDSANNTKTWKTIVVGGLGQGGQGYYALDATNETQLGAANTAVKWEFTDVSDASLGYTFGAPLLYNVRASATTVTPAVIFANGYENDWDDTATGGKKTAAKGSALFILNANTGAVIKKITLPAASTGLSSPVGVDVGQDGILDYVYAGDINGKLWRFDLTDSSPSNFKVITTPIFDAGVGQPIVMRPVSLPVNKASDGSSRGNIVVFGTGKLLTNTDRSDLTPQALYGVLDTMEDAPTTVALSDLQQQTFDSGTATVADGGSTRAGTYRKVSQNDIDLTSDSNTKLGWYVNLPDSSERLITTPQLLRDVVIFGTAVPVSNEKCIPGGKGWIIGLNPLTGSITKKDMKKTGKTFSFVDINGDGKSSANDKLGFGSGLEYVSAFSTDGIPTEQSIVGGDAIPTLIGPNTADTGYGDVGGVLAMTDFNTSGVFQGNQRVNGGVKTGKPIKVPETPCKANLFAGTIGSDTITKSRLNCAGSSAARVLTTTWREIK